MNPKIAIAGDGNVGSALGAGLSRAGYDVSAVGKDPRKLREEAQGAGVVILAVPYPSIDEVLAELGAAIEGKPVVDVTNPLTREMRPALGFNTSAAEEIQKKAPKAKIVKAFNTQFAANMSTGQIKGEKLSTLIAGDDAVAKRTVLDLARDIGFDAVDAGPLQNARFIEALGYLNIQLGYAQKMGTAIGFRLVR